MGAYFSAHPGHREVVLSSLDEVAPRLSAVGLPDRPLTDVLESELHLPRRAEWLAGLPKLDPIRTLLPDEFGTDAGPQRAHSNVLGDAAI